MKIKIAVILLLLIASILLLSSCGSFLIYKGSSPEFNVEKTFSGDTEYIIKSGLPKETVDYFSFIETSSVFNLDYDDIIDIYGKPEKESDVSGGYMALKELQYECCIFHTESTSGYLYYAELEKTADSYFNGIVRGINVGSSYNDVLSTFPNNSCDKIITDERGREYIPLYELEQQSGRVYFDDKNVAFVEYYNEGVFVVFDIEGDKVKKITFKLEL